MPYLEWISDENLDHAVDLLLQKSTQAKANAVRNFGRNVIDPFSALFEIAGFSMSYEEWIKSETARQAQKTLQNHVGDFHQNILGSCNGWANLYTGAIVDLCSIENKVIAEVKNKFNTISGGKLADLYYTLEEAVMNKTSIYRNYTAYYVSIIPKNTKRYNIEFTPSNNKKSQRCPANPLVRYIDGASFYAKVTGKENALEELFDVLPVLIANKTGASLTDLQSLKIFYNKAYNKK